MPVSPERRVVIGKKEQLQPTWTTRDGETCKLYNGDVRSVLKQLPERHFHCVVTSPPYWGLRDYGTGEWQGGDDKCDHLEVTGKADYSKTTLGMCSNGKGKKHTSDNAAFKALVAQYKDVCKRCGAIRVDHQIGAETNPDCGTHGKAKCGNCFVCTMVDVFRQVYRVLRDDGTLWLNLGDTYCGSGNMMGDFFGETGKYTKNGIGKQFDEMNKKPFSYKSLGIKDGNLVGIPWRVALALQSNGWILRQDVIWRKPNPMPESIKNRCTKSHEYVFMFAKGMPYYFDQEPIREDIAESNTGEVSVPLEGNVKKEGHRKQQKKNYRRICGANKRSVWTVPFEPYSGAHFATYPPSLIKPAILAGTSEYGCCVKCETPWLRVIAGGSGEDSDNPQDTVGWKPGCECYKVKIMANYPPDDCENRDYRVAKWWEWWRICEPIYKELEVRPCRVLDPFMGSGTTAVVSCTNGRACYGIDLSKEYIVFNQVPRIEGALMSIYKYRHLVEEPIKSML